MKLLKKYFSKILKKRSIDQINKNISILTVKKILSESKFQNKKNLLKYGYKVFSQQDEDGIIDEIFNRIGFGSKKFIEMGLETGVECNTTTYCKIGLIVDWVNQKNVEIIKRIF